MVLRGRWEEEVELSDPGQIRPWLARLVRRFVDPVVRALHRPTLTGTEHLPERGPFLLVANHSAGIGLAEILSFLVMYLRRVGPDRRLAGFVLPLDFRVFPLSVLVRGLGAIPSTYAAAERTLAAGIPILIFPGGDHESLRPIWQANRVDFGGRVGFLRIAHTARVPVVPLGIRGGHLTAPVLLRSRLLATLLVVPRLLGVKRWGISLLGLIVAALLVAAGPWSWPLRAGLVWVWLGSPLVFLPWVPWTIRMRIGAPLAASELFAPVEGDAESDGLQRALGRVQEAVQSLVDEAPR
jgi:1-acyl-sn-glycerol-3-phosphate acyltransferase